MTLRKRIGLITVAFIIASAVVTHIAHRMLFVQHIHQVDQIHLSYHLETCRKGLDARWGDLARQLETDHVKHWARTVLDGSISSPAVVVWPTGGTADWFCVARPGEERPGLWWLDSASGMLAPATSTWSLPPETLTSATTDTTTGLLLLDRMPPMLVAWRTLREEDTGAPQGTLVGGRLLSSERLDLLASFSGLELEARTASTADLDAAVVEAGMALDPIRNQTLSGAVVLIDVTGRQALFLEGAMKRALSDRENWLVYLAWVVELTAILLLVGLIILLLQQGVIRPLETLNRSVEEVTAGRSDTVARLTAGVPEIQRLAEATDRMLEDCKATEQSLQTSEQRLKTALRIARMGYWEQDFETGALIWSPDVYEIFGLQGGGDELTRKAFFERVHPDDRDLVQRHVSEAIAQGDRYQLDHRIVWDDGAIRHVHENAEIQYDATGKPRRLLGVVMDITERRAIEDERARLAVALDQATDHILVLDPDRKVAYVNPAFSNATGFSRFELVGRDIQEFQNCEPGHGRRHPLWDALDRGEAWAGQIVNRRQDGQLYHVEATFSPVRDSDVHLACYVSVQRDITTSLQLEKQLRQAQKMEAVGQLAGGVAHDFNNLLQAISGYADMALEDAPEDSAQHSSISQIIRASDKAASLVRQLLSFSRQQTIHPRPIDLNDLVQDMAQMLNRVLGAQVTLRLDLAPDGAWAHADPGQMEQVVMNLCVNARDAMPEGGVIAIATELVDIGATYRSHRQWIKEGRYVRLTLSDTGTGIPEASLEHIFEPFYTTKDAGKGTGLGLATVYGILKRHSGYIDVRSAPGQGATFEVFLPPGAPQDARDGATPAVAAPSGSGETILLAEDDELVRSLACSILRRAGYGVIEARDGQEAVDLFHQHRDRIDLALLDLIMPRRNGRSAYEEIRKVSADLPILFCTGYTSQALDKGTLGDDDVECIQKPFSPGALLEKIRTHLHRGA